MIVGIVLAPYLPGDNPVLKNMIGLGVGRLMNLSTQALWSRYGKRLQAVSLWNPSRLVIASDSPLYAKLENYLLERYAEYLHSCHLLPRNGEIALSLHDALFARRLLDEFESHVVEWFMTSEGAISVQSRSAPPETLRRYVLAVSNFKSSTLRMTIYRATIEPSYRENGKRMGGHAEWDEMHILSNKRIANTIVDEEVTQGLFDDVAWFLANEQWYNDRGMPYKRGYLLHGVPGTGKTSAIKALANEHNLDLYTVDLGSVETNGQFSSLMGEINMREHNRPYLLVMEDLDHCDLFAPYRERTNERGVLTVSCFLNELDGVTEAAGRILIMTTNSPGTLEKCYFHGALLRPGRIDKMVHIGTCSEEQYKAIVVQQYGVPFPDDALVPPLNRLSPAALIGIIQRFIEDLDGFVAYTESEEFGAEVKEVEVALQSAKRQRIRRRATVVQNKSYRVKTQKNRIARIKKQFATLATERERLTKYEEELTQAKEREKQRKANAKKKKRKAPAPKRKVPIRPPLITLAEGQERALRRVRRRIRE